MRYRESREQSAEVLRLVIARMAEHDAPFNPMAFAVWYEHIAGINPRLSEALHRRLGTIKRLSEADVVHLYREYVAVVEEEGAQRITVDFERVMHSIAASAETARESAGEYGEQLAELERVLVSKDVSQMQPRVNAALESTHEIMQAVQSLRETALTSRKQIEQLRADFLRYRIEAVTDPLTRLLNRKGFEQRLHSALATPPPEGTTHCLVMFDIDYFKRINDTHGHLIGDAVLEGLGDLLRQLTAGSDASCARYGGEEFAVLLEGTTIDHATRLAESVCSMVRSMKVRKRATGEVIAAVTMSAGVAACVPGDDASTLIGSADSALYRSKAQGRDRVTVA